MRLGVTDFGGPADGPVLLLGPSLGTTAEALWGVAAALLAERFRVIAWELPGHAGTDPVAAFDVFELARGVLAIADERGHRTFAYAGDSIGGAVGLQLMLDAPARVSAATLLCTGARIGEPAAWHERVAIVRAGGTAALVAAMPVRWFGPGFADREPARAQALLTALAATDDTSYAAACIALADFDVRDRLAAVVSPVLAVAGTDDGSVPVASLRRIAASVQDGRLVVLDGVGHQAPAEVPEQVARLVASHRPGAPSPTVAAVRAAGMQVRREVLGDAHVDRATAAVTDFTADFQELITRYAWGSVWTRPGLDRRSRSMITLTALVARGHHEELALHIRAARRNGLTVDEIKEVLLHAAIYCGVPDANTAFRIAQRVLDDPETDT